MKTSTKIKIHKTPKQIDFNLKTKKNDNLSNKFHDAKRVLFCRRRGAVVGDCGGME